MTKLKLLDFWAPWCGPCAQMKPILDEIERDYADKIEIEKINVDEHKDISFQYGVMGIPTYILVEDGQEIDRSVGLASKEEFLKFLKVK